MLQKILKIMSAPFRKCPRIRRLPRAGYILGMVLCLSLLHLPIAEASAEESDETVFGILYTTQSEDRTRLLYFDADFRPAGEDILPYSNLSFGGYENECRTEQYLFLNPKGPTGLYDAGTVLMLDPDELSFETYAVDRINITAFTADETYIYTLSNLNRVTYADRLSMSDSALDTVKHEGIFLDSAAVIDGKLYTFAYGDHDLCALCRVDFEQGRTESLLDLDSENPPCFLIAYGKKLLFTCGGILYSYDTQTGSCKEKDLGDERAYNLSLSGDVLAIGYTSILSMADSRIELYDLKEEKSICCFEYPGSVLQIEIPHPWNGKVYVLGYGNLTVFSIDKDNGESIEINTEETTAEIDTEETIEIIAETDKEGNAEVSTETNTEASTEIIAETDAEVNVEVSTEINTDTNTEVNTEADTELNREAATEEMKAAVIRSISLEPGNNEYCGGFILLH